MRLILIVALFGALGCAKARHSASYCTPEPTPVPPAECIVDDAAVLQAEHEVEEAQNAVDLKVAEIGALNLSIEFKQSEISKTKGKGKRRKLGAQLEALQIEAAQEEVRLIDLERVLFSAEAELKIVKCEI